MINLVVKDLFSQWRYLGFIFVLFVVFSFIGGFGHIYLSVGLLMYAMRIAYLEEKNNALLFLRTMPLKPSTIVMSKYVSILVVTCLSIVVGLGKLYIFQEMDPESVISFFASISTMLLMTGVFYVMYFKMGYMKATTFFRIVFLTVFVLIFASATFVEEMKPVLEEFFARVPLTWGSFALVELIVILLYMALGGLAVRTFHRQEISS